MKYTTTDTALTSIANAIREKSGTSNPLTFPDGFVSAISTIQYSHIYTGTTVPSSSLGVNGDLYIQEEV